MSIQKQDFPERERRKYLRLDTVIPVQFRLESSDGSKSISCWLQGFTSNISRGGICLLVNNLEPEYAKLLLGREARLSLEIELPLAHSPIKAQAEAAWVDASRQTPNKYLIGLNYEIIDQAQNKAILRYAYFRKNLLPAASILLLVFFLAMLIFGLSNAKLIRGNRELVRQLSQVLSETGSLKERMQQALQERGSLEEKIDYYMLQIKRASAEKEALEKGSLARQEESTAKISALQAELDKFSRDKETQEAQLGRLKEEEGRISRELGLLNQRKKKLTKANFDRMYQWLSLHQDSRTGLVSSYEGDSDIKDWAFIYDQSLAAQVYTYFGDFERAQNIISFFAQKANRKEGLFFNAYYASVGEPAEYSLQSGPNIWLGIAILQYSARSQDKKYLWLAEDIASSLVKLQDKEGGLRGGPQINWYSTEHNLDAYAFFKMLYQLTGKVQYQEIYTMILKWIAAHTYSRTDIPVKRGKGDATIATDTYAWSIAAVGPARLEELGMEPEQIISFAEENCQVEVKYTRPDGNTVKIRGFDFASQRHLARGGLVSSEWTAQMVIAYKIMAKFYSGKGSVVKAQGYEAKAEDYLANLCAMIISSPSASGQGQGCLPYATQDAADTGHGWFTPKGKNTGSLSGTAYTVFAYYGYNPLELAP